MAFASPESLFFFKVSLRLFLWWKGSVTHADLPAPFSFGGCCWGDDPHICCLEGSNSHRSPQLPATPWFCSCLHGLASHGGLTPWDSVETQCFKASSEVRLAPSLVKGQRRGQAAPVRLCEALHTQREEHKAAFHSHVWRTCPALELVT